MGEGIWRRRGETPSAVRLEERIIEVREGCWSYVAGSVGIAPGLSLNYMLYVIVIDVNSCMVVFYWRRKSFNLSITEKVVGTAIPKRDQEDKTATWSLSTGYILTVDWEEGPGFHLHCENSDENLVS